jgi:hypothetical protein
MAEPNSQLPAGVAPRAAEPPRFSIVVPLFDCRDAGVRALESALAQDFRRERYEVLSGGNNDVHESRAAKRGNFTLGDNCVIRRATFIALGGFAQRRGVYRAGVGWTDVAGFCCERRLRIGADRCRRPTRAATHAPVVPASDRPLRIDLERTA